MPNAHRRCPHCGGSGRVQLSGVYAKTLDLLREAGGEIHAAALASGTGVSGEAMCNRLRALERHGFVASRVSGRKRLYRALEAEDAD